jgi:hypothetical protein
MATRPKTPPAKPAPAPAVRFEATLGAVAAGKKRLPPRK